MSVIQNIGTEQAPPVSGRVAKPPDLSSQQPKTVTPDSGKNGQEYVLKLSWDVVDLAQLQEMKAGLHERAKSIRRAESSMEQINDYIDRMKENLNTIVKTFPPYPPGSEERVRLLKSYSAFRKLIEQLSFSPEDRGEAASISGQAPVEAASKEGMSANEGSDAIAKG